MGGIRVLLSPNVRLVPRVLFVVAGAGLGILLLIYLLRSVDLNQLGADFADVDFGFLALAVVPFLINWLLKVPRWALLYGEEAPSWDTLFGAMNVGYAVNALLPLRVGEIVRAYWVRDQAGVGMVRTLSTIALERVTDGLAVFALLLLTAPTVAFPGDLLGSALTIGAILVAVMVFMVTLAYSTTRPDHPLNALVQRLAGGRLGVLGRMTREIGVGLKALRNRRAIVLLVAYTLIIWATNGLLAWLVLRAFHIETPLISGLLLTSVLNLGMAVPSSPGYVGVFDYLMVLTLGLYNVGRTPALAAALALHAIAFVPVTIVGLAYIVRTGLEVTLHMLRTSVDRTG